MRKYERHASSIPIKFFQSDLSKHIKVPLVNIGHGGMSCHFPEPVTIGNVIDIRIDSIKPPCDLKGEIKWCRKFDDHFELGLQFENEADDFLKRMVEQICHIEHYRIEINRLEGRELTSEEAAFEWIEKYAKDYPR